MSETEPIRTCPNCGATVPGADKQCPVCGEPLGIKERAWYKNLTPTEIFLLILGSIMLMVAVVAL